MTKNELSFRFVFWDWNDFENHYWQEWLLILTFQTKLDVDVFEWYCTLFTNHINITWILVLSRSHTWVLVLSFPYLLIEVSMFTKESLEDIIFAISNTHVTSTKLLFAGKMVLFSPPNQQISNCYEMQMAKWAHDGWLKYNLTMMMMMMSKNKFAKLFRFQSFEILQ